MEMENSSSQVHFYIVHFLTVIERRYEIYRDFNHAVFSVLSNYMSTGANVPVTDNQFTGKIRVHAGNGSPSTRRSRGIFKTHQKSNSATEKSPFIVSLSG